MYVCMYDTIKKWYFQVRLTNLHFCADSRYFFLRVGGQQGFEPAHHDLQIQLIYRTRLRTLYVCMYVCL